MSPYVPGTVRIIRRRLITTEYIVLFIHRQYKRTCMLFFKMMILLGMIPGMHTVPGASGKLSSMERTEVGSFANGL